MMSTTHKIILKRKRALPSVRARKREKRDDASDSDDSDEEDTYEFVEVPLPPEEVAAKVMANNKHYVRMKSKDKAAFTDFLGKLCVCHEREMGRLVEGMQKTGQLRKGETWRDFPEFTVMSLKRNQRIRPETNLNNLRIRCPSCKGLEVDRLYWAMMNSIKHAMDVSVHPHGPYGYHVYKYCESLRKMRCSNYLFLQTKSFHCLPVTHVDEMVIQLADKWLACMYGLKEIPVSGYDEDKAIEMANRMYREYLSEELAKYDISVRPEDIVDERDEKQELKKLGEELSIQAGGIVMSQIDGTITCSAPSTSQLPSEWDLLNPELSPPGAPLVSLVGSGLSDDPICIE